MAYPPIAIANEVLKSARQRGLPITIMQLIKLVYIAHGWTLALLNRPLADQAPQAWQHGPVYRDIYNEFRGSGWSPITETAKHPFSGAEYAAELDPDERGILESVVENYGKLHAFELSARTHQPDTPWSKVYKEGDGKYQEIPNSLIKKHFDRLNAVPA
jgi:uncharacterized phage-associated protein